MKSVVSMFVAVTLLLSIGLLGSAHAVSPSPLPGELEEREVQGTKVKGEPVCLFQSGTEEVRKTISVHDVIPVYRADASHELREVGAIKVISYAGADYLRGEVVGGEIRAGDIAKKGDVASLVVSAGNACR